MRRLLPLYVISTVFLAACGGGSSSTPPTPTPRATKTVDPNADTPTRRPTKTPTQTGGPTYTATATGQATATPRPTKTPGPPATLYVRQVGDDMNSGLSPDAALKTIGAALKKLTPGSTLYVGRGTYKEQVQINRIAGTADLPVQIIADRTGAHVGDSGGDVIIDANSGFYTVLVTGSTYVTLDGFFLRGAAPSATATPAVSAVVLHARIDSDHFTVQNCVIANAATADGIRIDNSADSLVFNNLIYSSDRGIFVSGTSDRTDIINNTVAVSVRAGISIRTASGSSPNSVTVSNNIVQAAESNIGIDASGAGTRYSGDYNLIFEPALDDQSKAYNPAEVRGEHDVNADAQFVNVDVGDVHLADGSPAIDAGTGHIGAGLGDALMERTTRPGNERDHTPIDIGYHYPR